LADTELGAPIQQENCFFERDEDKTMATKSAFEFASLNEASKACLPGSYAFHSNHNSTMPQKQYQNP